MREPPPLPPAVVFATCVDRDGVAIPMPDQAQAAGLSLRTLYRIGGDATWRRWRIGHAEAWCAACGFDLWHLDRTSIHDKVNWLDLANPRIYRALCSVITALGQRPTREAVRKLAKSIQARLAGNGSPAVEPELEPEAA